MNSTCYIPPNSFKLSFSRSKTYFSALSAIQFLPPYFWKFGINSKSLSRYFLSLHHFCFKIFRCLRGKLLFIVPLKLLKKDNHEQGESQTVLLAVTNDWTDRDSFSAVDPMQLMSGTWQSYTPSHRMSPHRSHLRVYAPHDKQDKCAGFH